MTSTRERQKDAAVGTEAPPWAERSLLPTVRGVPVWGSIAIAVVLTAIGTVVDQVMSSEPGTVALICYFLGCVAAVLLAERGSLFGPMVQAPLVISIVLPIIVLITGNGSGTGGMSGKLLSIVNPLISSFPVMAGTTVATVGLGLLRMYYLQRADAESPDAEPQVGKASSQRTSERGKSARKRSEGQRGERGEPKRRPSEAKSDGAARSSEEARRGRETGSGRERSTPPGRSGKPRQAPGRSRPPEARPGGEPPRRPRRPRGDSFE